MSSKPWKLVDFSNEVGSIALAALLEIAPQFCEKANPNLLDCLRSSKTTGFETSFLQREFTEAIWRHLPPTRVQEYEAAMVKKFGPQGYPAPVQIVKWWQLGLYCQARSTTKESQRVLPSPEWMQLIQPALDDVTQIDPKITNPDAGKKLAELMPSLRTEPIVGLQTKIDELLKVAAYHFTANIRTISYLGGIVTWEDITKYCCVMDNLVQGRRYPNLLEVILSAQYPLCMKHLIEEEIGTTPNRRLQFRYKDY